MSVLVTVDDIEKLLPRPLDPEERDRADKLIIAAMERIREEFGRAGASMPSAEWFELTHARVVREMVSAAVLVGINIGMRSASSSTGQQSDAVTFADVDSVSWGGIALTDEHRRDLGLPVASRASHRFPPPPRWPERRMR